MQREPAKLLIERRHAPERAEAFAHWTRRVLACARTSGCVSDFSVLTIGDEAILLLRFEDRHALVAWEAAPRTRRLLAEWPYADDGSCESMVRSGLETWFTLPSPLATAPPKWKMALVTWCALLPHSLFVGHVLPKDLPYPLGPAIASAVPLVSLTWLVMPRLSVWLRGFLYGRRASSPRPLTCLGARSP
ncbi:MAG: antibiotic biosynthesis monooxygenase [Polyangiales bacterium]